MSFHVLLDFFVEFLLADLLNPPTGCSTTGTVTVLPSGRSKVEPLRWRGEAQGSTSDADAEHGQEDLLDGKHGIRFLEVEKT